MSQADAPDRAIPVPNLVANSEEFIKLRAVGKVNGHSSYCTALLAVGTAKMRAMIKPNLDLLKKASYSKTITFYPTFPDAASFIDPPKPAITNNIPDWIRKTPKYKFGQTSFEIINGENNLTVRHCIPLLEGFTSGYTFTTHIDLQVSLNEFGRHTIKWIEGPVTMYPPVRLRPPYEESIENMPFPKVDGYARAEFNWIPAWSIRTPRGYSCIFTHPVNRIDLPFYTLGAVVDTDMWGEAGNQPFLFKKDWEGLIPKGTPFLQIIPFKRDDWNSEVITNYTNTHEINLRKRDSVLRGWYKRNAWSTKRYK